MLFSSCETSKARKRSQKRRAAALLPWDEHWVKLWEGPDLNAFVDDVRGSLLFNLGGWQLSCRAHPGAQANYLTQQTLL
jgi:hypothetical protein